MDCSNTCDCVSEHAKDTNQTCDRGTGICLCKDSWQGTRCEFDVCDGDTHGCSDQLNEMCYNDGSMISCVCGSGMAKTPENVCTKGMLESYT